MNETALLQSIHGLHTPFLDGLFLFSHELGTLRFSALLALVAISWHVRRGERRAALAWLVVGLTTISVDSFVKPGFGRARPELWPRMIEPTSFSFPSGHALVSATLFPLFAWVTLRLRRIRFLVLGVGVPLFVGFGRLYLGVHWPTDVLAGWALGATQAFVAIRSVAAGSPKS